MKNLKSTLYRGIITENATFVMFLGLCPTLAMTSKLNNAVAMGISVTIVLMFSNGFISLIRKHIPDNIRIPVYITVIASIVTLLEIFISAVSQDIYESLGIYLPLIVVNCIVLGRAEAFAKDNNVGASILDGLAVGLGFLLSLSILASFRELFGTGQIAMLKIQLFPEQYAMGILVQSAGAFLMFGLLAWGISTYKDNKKKKGVSE